MASAAKPYNYFLEVEERSAAGKGWEARRSGRSITENPYRKGLNPWEDYLWQSWRDGWTAFKPKD